MKKMKRVGALVLILLLIASATVTVFAVSANPYPLKISANEAKQIAINWYLQNGCESYNPSTGTLVKNGTEYRIVEAALSHNINSNRICYSFALANSPVWLYFCYVDATTGKVDNTKGPWGSVYDITAKNVKISGITTKSYDGKAVTQKIIVKYGSWTLTENKDYVLKYKNNNRIGTATVEIWGAGNYVGKITKTFKIVEKKMDLPSNAKRVFGSTRYETATKIAAQLKKENKNKAFPSIIVATGDNYPDALTGAYLAYLKDAPILLTTSSKESSVLEYIKSNLKNGGTVYILGGTKAVPNSFATKLKNSNLKYKRLEGKTRFETNLEILKEAGSLGKELIVVTGNNYPDALSASALKKPILIVNNSLTKAQKNFISSNKFSKITIIGGNAAVKPEVKTALGSFAKTGRISGQDRYDTSAKVASTYFRTTTNMIVLAIGSNYPDALTGSALAMKLNAPMILTNSSAQEYNYAKNYRKSSGAKKCIVLGGSTFVTNHAVDEIMNKS